MFEFDGDIKVEADGLERFQGMLDKERFSDVSEGNVDIFRRGVKSILKFPSSPSPARFLSFASISVLLNSETSSALSRRRHHHHTEDSQSNGWFPPN